MSGSYYVSDIWDRQPACTLAVFISGGFLRRSFGSEYMAELFSAGYGAVKRILAEPSQISGSGRKSFLRLCAAGTAGNGSDALSAGHYLYRRGCRVGICSMDGDNGGNFFVRGIRPIWAEGDCIGLGKRAAPLFIAGACLYNAYGLVLLSEHGNVSSGAAGRGGIWQGKAISGQENTASAYDGGYPYRGERSGKLCEPDAAVCFPEDILKCCPKG